MFESATFTWWQEQGVVKIRNFEVPQLIDFDDDLWVIEMTIVIRPFVLDFAGAYLDRAPDFSEEVMADWYEQKREQFGKNWPEAQAILASSKPTVSSWKTCIPPTSPSWVRISQRHPRLDTLPHFPR